MPQEEADKTVKRGDFRFGRRAATTFFDRQVRGDLRPDPTGTRGLTQAEIDDFKRTDNTLFNTLFARRKKKNKAN